MSKPESWRIWGLSALLFLGADISAQPGKRVQVHLKASAAKGLQYSGTQGYLFPLRALETVRNRQGLRTCTFSATVDYPFEPLGTAFLVAPDLLLSAGNIMEGNTAGGLVWIPVQFLARQVSDSVVFPVSGIRAQSFTGVRGSDENYALLQLGKNAALPIFTLNFSTLKAGQSLRCCMDDGTLQPVNIEADEGIRSLFVTEQFPGGCIGSAILDAQGLAVGILVPGPHAGTPATFELDLKLYGNAVQRIGTLPVQVVFVLMEANVKQALHSGNQAALTTWLSHLNLFCGSGSDIMIEAAKVGNVVLLDTLLSMSCMRSCMDVNRPDEDGTTLLNVLLRQKNYGALNRLFRCPGFSINTLDGSGRTALHHAVYSGEQSHVELLLLHGANVNIRDQKGEPPLFEAVRSGNVSICRVLLANESWSHLSATEKKQVKDLVKAKGDNKLRQLFKRYR